MFFFSPSEHKYLSRPWIYIYRERGVCLHCVSRSRNSDRDRRPRPEIASALCSGFYCNGGNGQCLLRFLIYSRFWHLAFQAEKILDFHQSARCYENEGNATRFLSNYLDRKILIFFLYNLDVYWLSQLAWVCNNCKILSVEFLITDGYMVLRGKAKWFSWIINIFGNLLRDEKTI